MIGDSDSKFVADTGSLKSGSNNDCCNSCFNKSKLTSPNVIQHSTFAYHLHLCKSNCDLFNSEVHFCKSNFQLSKSCFHLWKSVIQLRKSIFHSLNSSSNYFNRFASLCFMCVNIFRYTFLASLYEFYEYI